MPIDNPSGITGLKFYTDTDDPSSITESSGKVSDHNDQTANNEDYSQATASKQPITNSVSKNGRNVFTYDGTKSMSTANISPVIVQPTTRFVFARCTDTGANFNFMLSGASSSARLGLVRNSNFGWGLFAGSNKTVGPTTLDTDWHFFICEFNGVTSRIYKDNVLLGTVDPGSNSCGGSTIGARYDDSSHWNGEIADSGLYDKILSSSERSDLDTWMREKYGELVPRIVPNPACVAGDAENTLTWDEANGFITYDLYFSTSTPVTTGDTKITGITSAYVHTGLSNGTQYYYAIVAQNDEGESPLSSEVSGTPVSSGPSTPVEGNTNNLNIIAANLILSGGE